MKVAIEAARNEAGAPASEVVLETAPADTLLTVCDERLVRQAVINLVANALHAPQRRSAVRVAVESDAESLVIRVADDGQGIPPALRERVLTPFYTTRPSGTGLGLAVVRNSAEAHGGDVVVTGTEGGGATFTMRLPRKVVVPPSPESYR